MSATWILAVVVCAAVYAIVETIRSNYRDTNAYYKQAAKVDATVTEKLRQADARVKDLDEREKNLAAREDGLRTRVALLSSRSDALKLLTTNIYEMSTQCSSGLPMLAQAYAEYLSLYDGRYAEYLEHKSPPALKAAEVVRTMTRQKIEAIKKAKEFEYIAKYYESIAPFLLDYRDELYDPDEMSKLFGAYDEEEDEDPVTKFLTKEEYRSLTTEARNQLALDRYFSNPRNKREVGRMYERYIGYIFEKSGYTVEYTGITDGYSDLGRDLIARKGRTIAIVQCKNWAQFRTIHENHIFQLFGTVFQFKMENPLSEVLGCFYTSTTVSELARTFARELKLNLYERTIFQRYPCIKCNVSKTTSERIYHLPIDQQYDVTKVESNRGESYALTVADAEQKGFRRAWKWRTAADEDGRD